MYFDVHLLARVCSEAQGELIHHLNLVPKILPHQTLQLLVEAFSEVKLQELVCQLLLACFCLGYNSLKPLYLRLLRVTGNVGHRYFVK